MDRPLNRTFFTLMSATVVLRSAVILPQGLLAIDPQIVQEPPLPQLEFLRQAPLYVQDKALRLLR